MIVQDRPGLRISTFSLCLLGEYGYDERRVCSCHTGAPFNSISSFKSQIYYGAPVLTRVPLTIVVLHEFYREKVTGPQTGFSCNRAVLHKGSATRRVTMGADMVPGVFP